MKIDGNNKVDRTKELAEVEEAMVLKLKSASRIEVRALGLEVLPRLVVYLREHQLSCIDCRTHLDEAVAFIDKLDVIADGKNHGERKLFEKRINDAVDHVKSVHGAYAKGEMLSRFLLLGMVAGSGGGYLIARLVDSNSLIGGVLLGWVGGLIAGYLFGKRKERMLNRNNQQY
jgi:uncharacterized membrane protein YeaQ/YmgE (transglycosylase-associated protein family)